MSPKVSYFCRFVSDFLRRSRDSMVNVPPKGNYFCRFVCDFLGVTDGRFGGQNVAELLLFVVFSVIFCGVRRRGAFEKFGDLFFAELRTFFEILTGTGCECYPRLRFPVF